MGNENTNDELKKSPVVRFMDLIGELFVLNLVYLLFSLPLVTIGASTTALYAVSMKLVKNEEGPIFQSFLNEFKNNWKKSSQLWGLILVYLIILFSQYIIVINYAAAISNFYMIVLFIEIFAGLLTSAFVFPLMARYENSLKGTIKNAFLIGISHLGTTIKINCMSFGILLISVMYPRIILFTWFLWLFLLLALIAYLNSKMVIAVLESMNKEED